MAASNRSSDSNPFSDHAAIQDERDALAESTLSVGRNATLTLGTDAVIVLGWSRWLLATRVPLLTVLQMRGSARTRDSVVSAYYRRVCSRGRPGLLT